MNIVVIGLGGIGSVLVNLLCRFLNYSDKIENKSILLVDGDEYEAKNYERQEFDVLGDKVEVKLRELIGKFPDMDFDDFAEYITDENVRDVIREENIVFLCVDNHKTRKLISKYCSTLNNITLISGGNDWIDGNVQIYIRKDGEDVTPNLCAYHPEIETPDDKSPDEMSCEELSQSAPQLFFTNVSVATIMCWAFWNTIINAEIDISEIYFDIQAMAVQPCVRKIPNREFANSETKEKNVCVTQENN